MRNLLAITLCLISWAPVAPAQNTPSNPTGLLDHLEGNLILKGAIAGKPTTHDVWAHWILHREYLELHEVSREKDSNGDPAYEAVILVSWDQKANQFACLWLDSTAGGALTSPVTCRAKPSGDTIPFIFTISSADEIHTSFTYHRSSDTWRWTIDNVEKGKPERFADVELSRVR
jgi:hypothetical protein